MNRHHSIRHLISPRLGLGLLCQISRKQVHHASSHGFTLIESLVAIIVISVTVVSVLPPIFWATATRVQNRRVEQALQLAQGEIDRVRNGIERQDFALADLPPQAGADFRPNAPAPTAIENSLRRSVVPSCNLGGVNAGRPPDSATKVIPVDTDAESDGTTCKPEFYIQVFRGKGATLSRDATAVPDGFVVGVRVYSVAAFPGGSPNPLGLRTEPGKIRTTSGLGTQQTRPLAVQYSVVMRSNTGDGMSLYRQLCAEIGDGKGCFDPR